jgi:hypothetical protein
MSVINQVSGPAAGEDVFSPMVFEFAFTSTTCNFVDVDGSAAIDVASDYDALVDAGDDVRILNGAYLGVYRVIEKTPGTSLRLLLNTPFIGSSTATGSNTWAPNGAQDFQLIAGYSTGPEATVKPWQVTDEIRVSPNNAGAYRFDVSGFLRSRFAITAPVTGPNVPISIRYAVRLKTTTAIPDDAAALTAYYGLAPLTSNQQAGLEPVGERPILFFGNQPTLYSLALTKGIVNNFIANPDAPASTTSGAVVSFRLLSCEPKTLTWLGASPTSGFTVSPALPSWIQATAVGNNIQLILNPCTAGVGDYLAADYNPLDYLLAGQINSITGCFSYVFSLSGTLFTLNVCVDPISEIVRVCPSDVLNFAWLNQRGGFSSFAVECKYEDGREFGSDNTVVDATGTLKRVEFRDVYDVTEARGGVLSKNQIALLASLRSSIQAFLYNTQTAAFDIPIVIDRTSFRTYGNRFNQAETRFSFRFRKSRQVNIQTQ